MRSAPSRRRGGVATQRPAKPFTPVRFWSAPLGPPLRRPLPGEPAEAEVPAGTVHADVVGDVHLGPVRRELRRVAGAQALVEAAAGVRVDRARLVLRLVVDAQDVDRRVRSRDELAVEAGARLRREDVEARLVDATG